MEPEQSLEHQMATQLRDTVANKLYEHPKKILIAQDHYPFIIIRTLDDRRGFIKQLTSERYIYEITAEYPTVEDDRSITAKLYVSADSLTIEALSVCYLPGQIRPDRQLLQIDSKHIVDLFCEEIEMAEVLTFSADR